MTEVNHRNTSIFFIPIWIKDFDKAVATLRNCQDWTIIPYNQICTNYLLSYVNRIISDKESFISFQYNEDLFSDICVCASKDDEERNKKYEQSVKIAEFRVSIFGTGIAFAELCVVYNGLSSDEICDYIYDFKKVYKTEQIIDHGQPFINIVKEALSDNCVPFFFTPVNSGKEAFKNECLGFHMLRFSEDEINVEQLNVLLFRLRRGYSTAFKYTDYQGPYDFTYSSSSNDFWSGIPEGIVNIVHINPGNYFFDNLKYPQLMKDYRFMYLMLLNQRFAAIKYIENVAIGDAKTLTELNDRIVKLKTAYSFRVVSNDMIYQNLYVRMYKLLEIDNILDDLNDNEKQVSVYYAKTVEKSDKLANKLLYFISLLSIFSFLIDASSYFDLFIPLVPISKWISLGIVFIAVICWLIIILRNNKKNN